jgi:hypothetical protein
MLAIISMCQVFFRCIWFRCGWFQSMFTYLSQSPILASILRVIDSGTNILHWTSEIYSLYWIYHILNHSTRLPSMISKWHIEVISHNSFQCTSRISSPLICYTFFDHFPVILFHLILYLTLIYWLSHCSIFYDNCSKWNLRPARREFTIHSGINKYSCIQYLYCGLSNQLIFCVDQMFNWLSYIFVDCILDNWCSQCQR